MELYIYVRPSPMNESESITVQDTSKEKAGELEAKTWS